MIGHWCLIGLIEVAYLQGFFPVLCLKAEEAEVHCVFTLTTVCEIQLGLLFVSKV